ncbi:hypothetical protein [Dyella sp.]|uniref:hypothetical protein n=1 Tax=Dyella sp. TaxID=1869338 RepID=UPI002ED4B5BA
MRRATRTRLVVLLGVAVIVVAAGWQWRRDMHDAPGALLDLDAATVHDIALQFPPAATQHFKRHDDGHWWTAGDRPARADDGRLGELADVASAQVLQWRPVQDFTLSKIGLAPPMAVLELDGQRVAFGETSVTGPQRYVQVGNRIALIPARFTPRPVQGKTMSLGL